METPDQASQNKATYARFVDLLNRQDFETMRREVIADDYREICVGFTPGWVDYDRGVDSLKKVLVGIPDLRAEILDSVAEGDKVYARLTVRGTNTGSFYGAPATNRPYKVSMFDYVQIKDGKITERVQQSDTFSQMRQIYGGALKWLGIGAGVAVAGLVAALARK